MKEQLTKIAWVIRHPTEKNIFHTGRTMASRKWDEFHKARIYDRAVDAKATITRCLEGTGIIKSIIITVDMED